MCCIYLKNLTNQLCWFVLFVKWTVLDCTCSGILHLLREAKNGDVVENVSVVLRMLEDFLNTRPSLLRLHCRGRCVVIADLKKNWTDSLTILRKSPWQQAQRRSCHGCNAQQLRCACGDDHDGVDVQDHVVPAVMIMIVVIKITMCLCSWSWWWWVPAVDESSSTERLRLYCPAVSREEPHLPGVDNDVADDGDGDGEQSSRECLRWHISPPTPNTTPVHNVYFVKYIFPRSRTTSNLS